MKDREPRNQRTETSQPSSELTPETLSQRLRETQRNVKDCLIDSAGAGAVMLLIPLSIIGASSPKPEDVVGALSALLLFTSIGGGIILRDALHDDLVERKKIIHTAVERGFNVRGILFKRIH